MLIELFSFFIVNLFQQLGYRLRNHMCHLFWTYTFHMRYAYETSRFRIVPFWTVSECPREHAYDETPGLNPVEISAV
jgi:hypothetical protein